MLEKAPELISGLVCELNRFCRSGATSDLHRLFRSPSGGPFPGPVLDNRLLYWLKSPPGHPDRRRIAVKCRPPEKTVRLT